MHWLSKLYFTELLSKTCANLIDRLDKYVLDGHALNMECLYGQLLKILSERVGETGKSESAVECLRRLLNDLDYVKSNWVKPYIALNVSGVPYRDINEKLPNHVFSDPSKSVIFDSEKPISIDCVRPNIYEYLTTNILL